MKVLFTAVLVLAVMTLVDVVQYGVFYREPAWTRKVHINAVNRAAAMFALLVALFVGGQLAQP